MLFTFADTQTERIDFRKEYKSSPKIPKAYQQNLNETRQRLCDTLLAQPSSQALVEALEAYLPHVLALVEVGEKDRLVEVEYGWRSVLTVGLVSGLGKNKVVERKVYRIASVYFEVVYISLALALALANMASKRAGAQPALTAESTLNEAIDMYSRASGILSHAGLTWSTRWSSSPSAKHRPPETTPAGLSTLSEFMLLQAQILAAVKAEKRGMSPTTIVKLQRGVLEKFRNVQGHLANAKSSDWSDSFQAYIKEGAWLYEALMLKKYSAHLHAEDKNGLAVACMTRCLNLFTIEMKALKTPCWLKLHTEHKDELKQLLDTYVRINNHVTYDKVPNETDMFGELPPATCLVERKPYLVPEAAEIPEPSPDELAAQTAAMKIQDPDASKSPATSPGASPAASTSDAEPEEEEEVKKPKASVRNAFKSLLKMDKSEVHK